MDYKKKLDDTFSLYIRLRDTEGHTKDGYFKCISCGKYKPFHKADCGHYINRQHMAVRFDEQNCNAQCSHCNRFMESNADGYRRGLIKKYGLQAVELLELKKYNKAKYSDFEYKLLIKKYQLLIKEYQLKINN